MECESESGYKNTEVVFPPNSCHCIYFCFKIDIL